MTTIPQNELYDILLNYKCINDDLDWNIESLTSAQVDVCERQAMYYKTDPIMQKILFKYCDQNDWNIFGWTNSNANNDHPPISEEIDDITQGNADIKFACLRFANNPEVADDTRDYLDTYCNSPDLQTNMWIAQNVPICRCWDNRGFYAKINAALNQCPPASGACNINEAYYNIYCAYSQCSRMLIHYPNVLMNPNQCPPIQICYIDNSGNINAGDIYVICDSSTVPDEELQEKICKSNPQNSMCVACQTNPYSQACYIEQGTPCPKDQDFPETPPGIPYPPQCLSSEERCRVNKPPADCLDICDSDQRHLYPQCRSIHQECWGPADKIQEKCFLEPEVNSPCDYPLAKNNPTKYWMCVPGMPSSCNAWFTPKLTRGCYVQANKGCQYCGRQEMFPSGHPDEKDNCGPSPQTCPLCDDTCNDLTGRFTTCAECSEGGVATGFCETTTPYPPQCQSSKMECRVEHNVPKKCWEEQPINNPCLGDFKDEYWQCSLQDPTCHKYTGIPPYCINPSGGGESSNGPAAWTIEIIIFLIVVIAVIIMCFLLIKDAKMMVLAVSAIILWAILLYILFF